MHTNTQLEDIPERKKMKRIERKNKKERLKEKGEKVLVLKTKAHAKLATLQFDGQKGIGVSSHFALRS